MSGSSNGKTPGRKRRTTVLAALGIVVVYFGVLVALMYPVANAAGYLT